ncbi:isochorismatase family protein [Nitzschia inconspicua]|uniref:Isochorismatase family protein n=1 Tax=Nitzschia inconspicua TaxID=303405 RepID=A0A9K3K7U3_9STRA|nr:isochorismatase family protein [Nitzschia inconspicua]KAG7367105.1 isochorismatase family protein [Nitzschia inconspicua]
MSSLGNAALRPGLIILDMSNDDWAEISYNKDDVIGNILQLAQSDFFHLCIESKKSVPKLKALSKGPKLVDALQKINGLQHVSKKMESAVQDSSLLETLQKSGITHVCICGISTDTSVLNTAKDLVANGFHIFVVMDATASKEGTTAHETGLQAISSQLGADVVVSVDDLLGDDEDAAAATQLNEESQRKDTTISPEAPKKPLSEMTDAERAEEMRRRDAEKLAARKKKFDAARFAHIEKANAKAQEQEEVFKKRIEEKRIPGAKYTPTSTATPVDTGKKVQPPCDKRKGWKLIYKKKEPPVVSIEPSKPLPPLAGKNERPDNVRQAVTPGWAAVDKKNERPHTYVHSSNLNCKGLAHSAPSPVNPTGQKFIPHDEPSYKKVGYGASGGSKPQMDGVSVLSKISGLQGNDPAKKLQGPRSMAMAKVKESKSESFDAQGNLIRTITRHITDPDGKKRTETEIIEIPKKN